MVPVGAGHVRVQRQRLQLRPDVLRHDLGHVLRDRVRHQAVGRQRVERVDLLGMKQPTYVSTFEVKNVSKRVQYFTSLITQGKYLHAECLRSE